jgi:hypothetical protein
MNNRVIDTQAFLQQATALARTDRNLEMMDRVMVLHGYFVLSRLRPENASFRKCADEAAARLLEAARAHSHWWPLLEIESTEILEAQSATVVG